MDVRRPVVPWTSHSAPLNNLLMPKSLILAMMVLLGPCFKRMLSIYIVCRAVPCHAMSCHVRLRE